MNIVVRPLNAFSIRTVILCALLWGLLLSGFPAHGQVQASDPKAVEARLRSSITTLSAMKDRSPGTSGHRDAAAFVKQSLTVSGIESVDRFSFPMAIRRHVESRLEIPGKGSVTLRPFLGNVISPGAVSPEGLSGPIIYVGDGRSDRFDGLPVAGAVVMMEMDSGKNWAQAASLGAVAVIYIGRDILDKSWFIEKRELTPIRMPRLWVSEAALQKVIPLPDRGVPALVSADATLFSSIFWDETDIENIYAWIPGSDDTLSSEILLIEAFYDTDAFVSGASPGADEASGIAVLLELAGYLKKSPPGRSILLVATGAHGQGLAGMRETIWSLKARSKDLKIAERRLKSQMSQFRRVATTLNEDLLTAASPDPVLAEALANEIKSEVDVVSRRLMQLRMEEISDGDQMASLAAERRTLRTLGWKTDFSTASSEEKAMLRRLILPSIERHRRMAEDAEAQLARLKASQRFRRHAREGEIVAAISLHLSSHGDGIGAFNQGWLHDLKSTINRSPAYARLTEALDEAARRTEAQLGAPDLYRDTLRPSRQRSWDSYLPDKPELGGEISALSGLHGITLATLQDNRPFWNTPYDLPDSVDFTRIAAQSRLVCGLIRELSSAPNIHGREYPRDGLSAVTGRANFLRQGELFADQPAPGTIVMAYQGRAIHYAMVDQMGRFQFRSVTDKKHQLHKVILEAYRFDPDNGRTLWAIDKKQTGKSGYRVKMQRTNMETQLVMFPCKASTLVNLLEPRNFRYMTRIDLIDARLEAAPLRYWWSRIDTRESTMNTLFLEQGTRYKLTLSDSILRKKMILTSATERRPEGIGYRVDDWSILTHTELRTARDMWALLGPRISSLENRGIYDERLARLQEEGTAALEGAGRALEERRYSDLFALASRSWALASRVYDQVEKTQKDVLFGVLFYIALFVPFAYCAERLLFSFRNIHKRIVAFLGILLLLIAVIYRVHPAFELAYSPTVVILAFFIMGLSLIVTLIIFFRFEGEMVLLQRRAAQKSSEEISRWKAFVAAFFLGVSNLRRRRIRTFLTCMTLIILTFTIMSFTSVKSSQHQTRVRYQETAPYRGLLLKTPNWNDLPREASGLIARGLGGVEQVVPRVWLETPERTSAPHISLRHGENLFDAKGLVGLSTTDIRRSGLARLLVAGRWFDEDDYQVAVISDRAAAVLGIAMGQEEPAVVDIWGQPYRICGVFDSRRLQDYLDLDGEPLTPVTFPNEALTEITEVEFDALESGEDVKSFQSRYQHTSADVTLFMPYQSVLAKGGSFKAAVAFLPEDQDPRSAALDIIERFGLMLFSGEPDGTFIYQSSDTIRYQGLPNVFIPMVISVLIVLNTMIGSVYERKGEISIYTSVGLAPSHVSFLFIAEALAFAVLSVVLGYLLAQGSAYGFAKTDLWAGITVNYSSMAGVGAMLLVIVVVLVSVIYPSRVAARIAIPDVNRSWRLPDHDASVMELQLPFMVKRSELESAGGFLLDHFQSHQDVSHGIFSTGDISVTAAGNGDAAPLPGLPHGDSPLCIASKVWLAPFDFGIMQRVEIRFQPSSVDGDRFLTIDLKLIREAGEAVTWGRVNREFVNMLRKQLLIWRNMDHQSAATYGRQLEDALTQSRSEVDAQ